MFQPMAGGALRVGQCARVNTGAPVPPGADCVVQVEDTKVLEETNDGEEELQIEIMTAPVVGQDIRYFHCFVVYRTAVEFS